MLTLSFILFPLVVGLILLLLGENKLVKPIAILATLIQFATTLFAIFKLKTEPDCCQLDFKTNFISSIGSTFHLTTDGINVLMLLLTNALMILIVLSTRLESSRRLIALSILMQSALNGVFLAKDGFLFYIFWELALIPIYFICLVWGGKDKNKIIFKFFIYTLAGSLLMLFGFLYIFSKNPEKSFDIVSMYKAGNMLSFQEQTWIFWTIFIAFAIKMPIFPFHTWQPKTYNVAPTQGTLLLSGIMLKMGTFGVIIWLLPMVTKGVAYWSIWAVALSVLGIVYGSLIAMVQKNYKKLLAYSSFAHVGLISAGIFSGSVTGIQGSLIQMISHGINVVGLFFICDILINRNGNAKIKEFGGVRSTAPNFALLFLIILLGSVALPLTNGFVGEFLLLKSVFDYHLVLSIIAGTTIILGAVYMLRSYQKLMLGETNEKTESFIDLTNHEKMVLIPIVILVIVLGIFPNLLLNISESSVQALVQQISTNK